MTRQLEAMLVMTGRHDMSLWGHAHQLAVMTAVSLWATHRHSGRRKFHNKSPIFFQTIYSYPTLYSISIATNEARTGEPATVLGYQYSQC